MTTPRPTPDAQPKPFKPCGAKYFGVNRPCVREKGHTGAHRAGAWTVPANATPDAPNPSTHSPKEGEPRTFYEARKRIADAATKAGIAITSEFGQAIDGALTALAAQPHQPRQTVRQPAEAQEPRLIGIMRDEIIKLRHQLEGEFQRGQQAMAEKAGQLLETIGRRLGESTPPEVVGALNCRQYAKAVRSLAGAVLAEQEQPPQDKAPKCFRCDGPVTAGVHFHDDCLKEYEEANQKIADLTQPPVQALRELVVKVCAFYPVGPNTQYDEINAALESLLPRESGGQS